jgi:hypothetical protein
MSTYYYFHCAKHQASGGCWTRQAWGWGNADLIDTFKFVMYHVRECGPENIGMHSEHEDFGSDWANTSFEDEHRRPHLEATRGIFPHSNDWQFVEDAPKNADLDQLWTEAELAELETS